MFRKKVSYHKIIGRKLAYTRFSRKLPVALRLFFNAISKWWDHWVEFILLGLAWTLAAVTVVFSPPVTFGVFYALRDPDEIENRFKLVLEGAKAYLGISYLNFLISLLVFAVGFFNLSFYSSFDSLWMNLLAGLGIALLFVWAGMQIYLIPVLFQQTTKNLWSAYRNAAGLFLANAGNGILMITIGFLLLILSIVFPPVLFVGSPILFMLYAHAMASHIMLKLELIQPEDTYYHDDPDQTEKDLLAVYEGAVQPERNGKTAK